MASEGSEKPRMIIGIDESEQSFYALEWALDHFFLPYSPNYPFRLLLVHAKPSPSHAIGLAGPGAAEVLPYVDADLKKIAARVTQQAKELCCSKSVNDAAAEIMEGDARNVLCEAVEKHHASILVVGSHGYGAIKRAVLGSRGSDSVNVAVTTMGTRIWIPCPKDLKGGSLTWLVYELIYRAAASPTRLVEC